jgi:hypothetical protein
MICKRQGSIQIEARSYNHTSADPACFKRGLTVATYTPKRGGCASAIPIFSICHGDMD